MIAKTDFTGAWDYFQSLYAGTLPAAEETALATAAGFASFGELQTKFKARVTESAARIHTSKAAVGPSRTWSALARRTMLRKTSSRNTPSSRSNR